jgi:hypothetical protein
MDDLFAAIRADGMVVRAIAVASADAVLFKSLLEAYPGLCCVHADPGAAAHGGTVRLYVAATPALGRELDEVLAELAAEMQLWLLEDDASTREHVGRRSAHGG